MIESTGFKCTVRGQEGEAYAEYVQTADLQELTIRGIDAARAQALVSVLDQLLEGAVAVATAAPKSVLGVRAPVGAAEVPASPSAPAAPAEVPAAAAAAPEPPAAPKRRRKASAEVSPAAPPPSEAAPKAKAKIKVVEPAEEGPEETGELDAPEEAPVRTGKLGNTPIPASVLETRKWLPIVLWLRNQGYDRVGDVYAVCVSTFRHEVPLLEATPPEFVKELVEGAWAELEGAQHRPTREVGNGNGKSNGHVAVAPPATAAPPDDAEETDEGEDVPEEEDGGAAFDVEKVAAECASAETFRPVIAVLRKHGVDGEDALVAALETLKPKVPMLQRVTNLRERVQRVLALLAGPGA